MARAYIALGSNLGDRGAHLRAALDRLSDPPAIVVIGVSAFLETAPVDCPDGSAPFLNAAAVLETRLPARDLLSRLLQIEVRAGRRREAEVKNAPRTVDLDLLLYDQQVLAEPGLVIPHPRMHERLFVLAPLARVAPEARHPVLGRTVRELLEELTASPSAGITPDRAGRALG